LSAALNVNLFPLGVRLIVLPVE